MKTTFKGSSSFTGACNFYLGKFFDFEVNQKTESLRPSAERLLSAGDIFFSMNYLHF